MALFERVFKKDYSNEELFDMIVNNDNQRGFDRGVHYIYNTRFWTYYEGRKKYAVLSEHEGLEAYSNAIMDLIRSLKRCSSYAEWHDSFPKYWKNTKKYDLITSFLYFVVKRRCIDIIRKQSSKNLDDEKLKMLFPTFDTDVNQFEEVDLYERAFQSLTDREQSLLQDYYFAGLEKDEMAEKYQVKAGSISQTVSRAKLKLLAEIKRLRSLDGEDSSKESEIV